MYFCNWNPFALNQIVNHALNSDDLWKLETLNTKMIKFKGGLSGWIAWQFLNALELFSP